MGGSGATVFSGNARDMPLTGFQASTMISGVVNSSTILPPLAQPPLAPLTVGGAGVRLIYYQMRLGMYTGVSCPASGN